MAGGCEIKAPCVRNAELHLLRRELIHLPEGSINVILLRSLSESLTREGAAVTFEESRPAAEIVSSVLWRRIRRPGEQPI